MSCGLYEESMMKFFDGELNDIENAQLKQHLKACKECSDEFEALSSIFCCIEKDLAVEPPPDFETQIMDKINALELLERKKPSVMKVLLLGMGTVLTFLMASALVYSVLGISIFQILSHVLGDSPAFAGVFQSAGTAFEGGITSVIEYARTIFEVVVVLAKTYYYFVVLIAVLLFALQWMVVTFVKQNLVRQKQVISDVH